MGNWGNIIMNSAFPAASFFGIFLCFFIIVIIVSILSQLFKSQDNEKNRTVTGDNRQNQNEINFNHSMNGNPMMYHNPTDMNMNGVPDTLDYYNADADLDYDGIPDYMEPDSNSSGISDFSNDSSSHFDFSYDNDSFSQGSGDIGNMDSGSSDNFNSGSFD